MLPYSCIKEREREEVSMARSVYFINYQCIKGEAEEKIRQILEADGFHMAEQEGNIIWVKGDVKTTGLKGIQIDYEEKRIKISGWIQGMIGGEVQLEGFASMIAKKAVKKTIEKIMVQIK